MKLSLDKAYDYALDPQLAHLREGVTIRFMPDAQQVKHALAVRNNLYGMIPKIDARFREEAFDKDLSGRCHLGIRSCSKDRVQI